MRKELKVYLSPPITTEEKQIGNYSSILKTLKLLKYEVLTSFVDERDLKLLRGNPGRKVRHLPLLGLMFSQKEYSKIEQADVLIVELTEPSITDGYLISHALSSKKPVLALFYKDSKENLVTLPQEIFSEYLFLEHYSKDNIEIVLKDFLTDMEKKMKQKGKLIVIEGSDGSGKKTQSDLLIEFLKRSGYKTKLIDFPRYYSSFHGQIVGRYLSGEFGDIYEINPYLASLAYALDRLTAKSELDGWLKESNIIVANRYTASNMAHMSARLPEKDRKSFLSWLDELEYKTHKLPREDIVIYLYVPHNIGQKLLELKKQRRYIKGGKKDIHERDVGYMRKSERMYLWLAENKKHWVKINCVNKNGGLRTKKTIHNEIVQILQEKGLIK